LEKGVEESDGWCILNLRRYSRVEGSCTGSGRGIREGLMGWEVQFILDEVAQKVNRVEGGIRVGEEDL
jgi:hypothetical protein